jgi:phage terminase large subunit-like protein
MSAQTFVAVPRYISPTPDSVDITEAHKAAESMGISLLPQGEQVATLLEAKNEFGQPLYPELVIQMGRRATKTSSIQATLLGRCFSIPKYRIISTAQTGTLSQQFLAELGSQLEMAYPDEATRPFRFYKSNGSIRIVWDNGSEWRAVKPQASAFRGSAADCILFDEAGEYDAKTSEDLLAGALPVLATRPNAQLIVTGTPPRTREGLLWQYLQAGRKGTEDLGILDYSMSPTQDATDESVWHEVYPGLSSGLVKLSFLRKALETQGLLSFSREFLCLDPVASSLRAIPEEDWLAGQVPEMLALPASNVSIAFDTTQSGDAGAVAVAWYTPDGLPHVQILEHKGGINWLPGYLEKLLKAHKGVEIGFDSIGNNLSIFQTLQRKRGISTVNLRSMTMKEVAGGVSLMTSHISDRSLVHAVDPSLDRAVEAAAFRYSGDSRLWSRGNSNEDISPLIAASNALYIAAGKRHKEPYKKRAPRTF